MNRQQRKAGGQDAIAEHESRDGQLLFLLGRLAATRQRDVTAGILFGVACSLKPQIGAFLVLYYLVRRRWQLFATALASTLGLAAVAALYLWIRGASWIQDYLHNARGFVSANHIDDFTSANPGRFTLINLQVPLFSITGHSSSANLLAFAVGGLLACAWIYWVARGSAHVPQLLSLGAISIICLLPVYHRFYDAGLLILPLCWCLTELAERSKQSANWTVKVALLLMIPFLVPATAGAMIAFSTLRELQMGQTSLAEEACASNAALSLNQPSKPCPALQRRL